MTSKNFTDNLSLTHCYYYDFHLTVAKAET